MSLLTYNPYNNLERMFDRALSNFWHDMEDFQREVTPYWHGRRHMLDFGNDEVSVTDERYAISLDVSSFHPSELKVAIDGQNLVITGEHHEKAEHGEMHRHFVRRYRIPDDIDPEHFKSNLSNEGKLMIEAPKRNAALPHSRQIPIEYSKL